MYTIWTGISLLKFIFRPKKKLLHEGKLSFIKAYRPPPNPTKYRIKHVNIFLARFWHRNRKNISNGLTLYRWSIRQSAYARETHLTNSRHPFFVPLPFRQVPREFMRRRRKKNRNIPVLIYVRVMRTRKWEFFSPYACVVGISDGMSPGENAPCTSCGKRF